MYRNDNVGQAQFVKEKVLDDLWWDNKLYHCLHQANLCYDKGHRHRQAIFSFGV